jgi:hypothetical protein
VTADLGRLLQGTLLTRDFLVEGIRTAPEYAALSDGDVAALGESLRAQFGRLNVAASPNEPTTEKDLIWPILGMLGWDAHLTQQNLSVKGRDDVPDGLLFSEQAQKTKANAEAEEWRRYAFGLAILEAKRWMRPLDRQSNRKGEETAPSTQMLRYLRRVDVITEGKLKWGILTNGAKWRLYFQGAKSVSEEFCEIDLQYALGLTSDAGGLFDLDDGESTHWLRVFLLVFRRVAFLPSATAKTTFLERALSEGRFYEERVAKSLADLVFEQVFPQLALAIANAKPAADLQDVREAALVLLYRLLFLLYAEDRDLLPVRDKRFDDYSLRERVREDVGRRKQANDAFSTTATKYWNAIDDLSRAIDKGDGSIGLPPYNGGLFDSVRTPLLGEVRIPDNVMADIIDVLSFEQKDGLRRYINYRDLSVQQLGSIYERLLEFELQREGGTVSVRPNIFARKRSGSYYTPEELVRVILDETLEPLISERMEAFKTRADELAASDKSEETRLAVLERVDPAEALLTLKICDPAMGSGHFLVSLVDTLTDQVINAIAEAAEAVEWGHYQSPLINRVADIRRRIIANAETNGWTFDYAQLDDRHIIRRMVLKRCIYGVDKNPMAVELAKVSLWLHTFTVGAPLSFLDHHLRCGDSLFGLSVAGVADRLAAKWGSSLLIADAMKRAKESAASVGIIEGLTDAEIAEAHRSADIWDGVVTAVDPLDQFMRLLHAFDWLDPKAEPANSPGQSKLERMKNGGGEVAAVRAFLDGQFGDPFQIARGRLEVDLDKPKAPDFIAILKRARTLIADERFLNWQTAYPGVWDNWESATPTGGFDAVIGNPPWDRMKMQEVEWFAARKQEIAMASRADDRKRMIARLKDTNDPLYADYERAVERADDSLRISRACGEYPLLSAGDVNIYSLFVERASRLVKPTGVVGFLTPSGIASDKTAAPFLKGISTAGRLKALYDVENRAGLFPDVDSRFKFCAFIFGGAGRKFSQTTCAFFLHRMTDLPERRFTLTAADFARVNPNTGTAPIFRTPRDAALVRGIYERSAVLVDHTVTPSRAQWPVSYERMLDMTNDSGHFRTRVELEEREKAFSLSGNIWQSASGKWLPLYVGRMARQFDHRAASVKVNEANLHNAALSDEITAEQKADPNFIPMPQYWVPESVVTLPPGVDWVLCFRDIARATDVRTIIAAAAPRAGYGNKLPLLKPTDQAAYIKAAPLMLGNLNALVFDFAARTKVHSTSVNWFIVEQLPVLPFERYAQHNFGPKSAEDIVRAIVLELTYTATDMAAFARDMGHVDAKGATKPPFVWDEDRRLRLRAKLDAVFFHLYGVTDRDDVRYIYSTFPIVEEQETRAHGRYLSRDLCLAHINALAAGQPDAEVGV